MSNPSDWNTDDDDLDEREDEIEGAFEDEHEYDDETEEDYREEDEEPAEAAAMGGCLRTMILAVAFWMVVALAALGFCVVFGGRW